MSILSSPIAGLYKIKRLGKRIFDGKIQLFKKSGSILKIRFRVAFSPQKTGCSEQKPFLYVNTTMKRYNGAVCEQLETFIQERVYHETNRQVPRPHTTSQTIRAFTDAYPETFRSVPFKGAVAVQKTTAHRILSFS
jgi:hypothetical protein